MKAKKKTPPKQSIAPSAATERAFAKVVTACTTHQGVVFGGGKGFGSGALKVEGKIFAMVSSKGKFVIKLPTDRVGELVRSGAGAYIDPGHGRLMKSWIEMDEGHSTWPLLAKEGLLFVRSAR